MILLAASVLTAFGPGTSSMGADQASISQLLNQPAYVENKGQWSPEVLFRSQSGNVELWLTRSGVTYEFRRGAKRHVVKMRFEGASANSSAIGANASAIRENYIVGKDQSQWRSSIRRFNRATLANVYPGIDFVAYFDAKTRAPRYDFVVHPGADPKQIRMRYEGAKDVRVDRKGVLTYATGLGSVQERDLKAFQADRKPVAVRRSVTSQGIVAFHTGSYDRTKTLTIDPVMFSTFLGGTLSTVVTGVAINFVNADSFAVGYTDCDDIPTAAGAIMPVNPASTRRAAFAARVRSTSIELTYFGGDDATSPFTSAWGVAVNPFENLVYVVGETNCRDLPFAGGRQSVLGGGSDGFVVRFTPNMQAIGAGTYLGGTGNDVATSVTISNDRNVFVAGIAGNATFPGTGGAAQATFGGGDNDAFVTKMPKELNANTWTSFLGGSLSEYPAALSGLPECYPRVAVNNSNQAIVAGTTASSNFPTTAGVFQTTGPTRVTEYDPFVAKLAADGASFIYSTFLGGHLSTVGGLVLDRFGPSEAVICGTARNGALPASTTAYQRSFRRGGADAYVAALNPAGTVLNFMTYLGGSGFDQANGLGFLPDGAFAVAGSTTSSNFPISSGSPSVTLQGPSDGFLAKISQLGERLNYSQFFGGSSNDRILSLSTDANGGVLVGGNTVSGDFPVTATAAVRTLPSTTSQGAGFVSRILPRVNFDVTYLPNFEVVGGNRIILAISTTDPVVARTRFSLSTTSSVIHPPASAYIEAGARTVSLSIPTDGVDTDQTATITVSLNGETRNAFASIKAAKFSVVSSSPASFFGGSTATPTLRVRLDGKAGPSGRTVLLNSSDASVTLPATAFIPTGLTTVNVPYTHSPVPANRVVTLSAFANGASGNVNVTNRSIYPYRVDVSSTTVSTGGALIATLTLSATPTSDVTVPVTYVNCSGPATVTIAAGTNSVNFGVNAAAVVARTTASFTAQLNGRAIRKTFTINP